jgi:hypothetical protein
MIESDIFEKPSRRLVGNQKSQQFGAGHQKLTTQGAAWLQLSAPNQPANAKIVDAKHGCGFPDGIRQPFGRCGWFFGFANDFHNFCFQAALPMVANKPAANILFGFGARRCFSL